METEPEPEVEAEPEPEVEPKVKGEVLEPEVEAEPEPETKEEEKKEEKVVIDANNDTPGTEGTFLTGQNWFIWFVISGKYLFINDCYKKER